MINKRKYHLLHRGNVQLYHEAYNWQRSLEETWLNITML